MNEKEQECLEQIHSELHELHAELDNLLASGKTHDDEEREAICDKIMALQDRAGDLAAANFAKMGLKVRGRHKTEARLRELYSQADGEHKGEIARFLFRWKSKRGLLVADDWMNDDPGDSAFRWILTRYSLCEGIQDGRPVPVDPRPEGPHGQKARRRDRSVFGLHHIL